MQAAGTINHLDFQRLQTRLRKDMHFHPVVQPVTGNYRQFRVEVCTNSRWNFSVYLSVIFQDWTHKPDRCAD
jgi:hypothetical protein